MSIYFQPTALVGAIAIAMGLSTSVSANTETQAKASTKSTLNTIVVTATRSEENIENVPARISIIEPAVLDQSPLASLPHLLSNDASINMVQSGGYGQQSSIFLRGTNSTHTLVLRDGVKLNSATSGTASLAYIDTTDLKQIEVLKGPASVLYGTNAIGGVVQLVSKTPEKTGAFLTGEIGENKTYKSIVGADLVENGFYAQIRGQRLESDGTHVTNAKQPDIKTGDFEQKGFSTKFGFENESIALSLDYAQNEGQSTYVSSVFAPYPSNAFLNLKNNSVDFKNESINAKAKYKFSDLIELNARLSQFKDESNQLDSKDFVNSKTQEADLYTKVTLPAHQNILFGTTYQSTKADAISSGSPYKGDVDAQGYYIQHQYSNHGLNTQVGIRVEDNEQFGTHTVGQVAVRYQILENTSIYTNWGTAFRAPNLNELYVNYYGNPNLKPEESESFELGIDQKLPFGLSTGLSMYNNKVKNLIDYNDKNGYILDNVSKAKFEGVESYINWEQDQLFAKLSHSYVKATNEETGKELARRPRQSLTLTAGLQNSIYGISTSVSSKSAPKDNSKVAGYTTVDLNAYWNVNPSIKLFTNIDNIGDVKFETASYGNGLFYINGGRQASVGVTFKY
ncbi:ligand-gated channel protein [Acinetobacter sp. Ac_877]|uniref:TonB-dependent receptor plug domain-containing protein n=1 Tax=Acinetobacter portensis TaxID=1839785 RepID=UPI00128C589C|nr:TonB-dependent receptor [Acinetobacter portensis]MPW41502.1 ligand-gated channel protein [Acinetobacter portensis]